MTYVITQPCCNDAACVDVCPVNCIHPRPDDPDFGTTEMLYIDPETCIDCGACVDVCPVSAIFPDSELAPEQEPYLQINADYFDLHPGDPEFPQPRRRARITADEGPLKVAIVGSGPAACYAAQELLADPGVRVNMFERLPTPFGLVRAGVAPDHLSTKKAGESFRSVLGHRHLKCWFNVEIGNHLSHDELMEHHHAVIYAVGAAGDRRMGVEGEDLAGSHAATDFVAWYNGHPEHADRQFDLSGERAVIIGNGNVALDIARLLVTDPDDLAQTDIAEHALEALRSSRIEEVVVVGRRGPAQAAFTNPELLALTQMPGIDVMLSEGSVGAVEAAVSQGGEGAFRTSLKLRLLQQISSNRPNPGRKRIVLRFLASPAALVGDKRVESIELINNELVAVDGDLTAVATAETETLGAGLIIRSIGYFGHPVPDVPFDEALGIVPNDHGRVKDTNTDSPVPGVYAAGWIKRGPSGVIGTNKACSAETADTLVADFVAGALTPPKSPDDEALASLVKTRQPEFIDLPGWLAIDRRERERGREAGRSRLKFVSVADLLAAAR